MSCEMTDEGTDSVGMEAMFAFESPFELKRICRKLAQRDDLAA